MIEKGQEWKVLDKGFIRYIDHMGSDESICNAARISYGKGTKSVSDDRNLIRYLMRHRHTSPTEMSELIIHVKAPIYVFRQWHRHRMASLNEYSGRYSEMIDECEKTNEDSWRTQSTTNKQGSSGFVQDFPDIESGKIEWKPNKNIFGYSQSPGDYLSEREREFLEEAREIYEERLKFGVAKEQARKDLPVSNYSEMIWKSDLHNLLHLLSLRMDSHAQKEIREYATIIGDKIVAELWPQTWEAFQDYRLQAVQFSRLEMKTLRDILQYFSSRYEVTPDWEYIPKLENKREQEEFEQKIKKLGIYYEV
jgi:thymidylate synthase (FAD)